MTIRTFILAGCISLWVPTAALADGTTAPGRFSLSVDALVLDIAPVSPGRTNLQLPQLEYRFQLETDCAGDGEPESFSLTVADSRVTLDRNAFSAQPAPQEFRLTVPAEQLAPITLTEFCVFRNDPDGAPGGDNNAPAPMRTGELLIPAAVTAHASLLCRSNDAQRITYSSTPLDIRLVCQAPAAGMPQAERGAGITR